MLPSDGGGTGSPWLSGVFDTARDAVQDLSTELSSFTTFRKRVDELVRDLKESQAGPTRVGREQLGRGKFGGGDGSWTEAAGLYTSYEKVITDLENFSELLSDCMEAMSIAVLASHKGYENIDVDVRDRMAAITAETTEHYGGPYDPERAKHHGATGGGTAAGVRKPPNGDAGGTI
ncbi:hypothetical protein [Streptomyces glaucescens]|uniref:Uncharacterized protein n=1 Tax=Streptomyces glaucescens TaxID=1907 RepID=A0A089XAK3_STRGA|nr:hypothetical protein [Streptomyces glaucescens]AIS00274.1 hypothetical protein SGLAU_21600 [Streptomyces glaucescens]